MRSEHPIAHAILRAAADLEVPIATDAQTVTGQGISGKVEGRYISIGNAKFAAAQGVNLDAQTAEITKLAALGNTVLFMAIDGLLTAVIAVSDPIKASTADTIAKLDALGFETVVITGDAKATANVIAKQLNIKHVIADVLPDGKRDAVLGLEGTTVFVGDGINDAPALATADVGIAIGTGTDVAINSADVVLMSGDLQGVLSAIKISRATMRNIRQNLFLGLCIQHGSDPDCGWYLVPRIWPFAVTSSCGWCDGVVVGLCVDQCASSTLGVASLVAWFRNLDRPAVIRPRREPLAQMRCFKAHVLQGGNCDGRPPTRRTMKHKRLVL